MANKAYQRKDHFYQRAKAEGFRSRAAYKLLEIDKKHRLFRPGFRVADLGCFPGGWLQVAADAVGERGLVVGVDLKEVEPLALSQVRVLEADFTEPETYNALAAVLSEHDMPPTFNVVLSDLSPALSGIRLRDALKSADLVERAYYFATQHLCQKGSFVAKIFPGNECEEVAREIKPRFEHFSRMNLDSTRKSSNEMYFVARGFKG